MAAGRAAQEILPAREVGMYTASGSIALSSFPSAYPLGACRQGYQEDSGTNFLRDCRRARHRSPCPICPHPCIRSIALSSPGCCFAWLLSCQGGSRRPRMPPKPRCKGRRTPPPAAPQSSSPSPFPPKRRTTRHPCNSNTRRIRPVSGRGWACAARAKAGMVEAGIIAAFAEEACSGTVNDTAR